MADLTLDTIPAGEVLRYLGAGGTGNRDLLPLVESCSRELLEAARPRWLWRVFDLAPAPEGVALAGCGFLLPGADLRRHLEGCQRAVLLAATLSADVDALLRRTQLTDLGRSVVLQSCAAAAIEEVCDRGEALLRAQWPGVFFTSRYSPGYGDLPVTLQRDFLALLDAPRRIGLCATGSSILTPSKSVTAILGLGDRPLPNHRRSCESCNLSGSCAFRRREEHCGL